jgi:NodT family efflux transporter outer membrane factor (OMF) lipoprotein
MNHPPRATVSAAAVLLAVVALVSGCAVGPNYVRPAVEVPAAYKELPGGAPVWRPAGAGATDAAQWWDLFADDDLAALERRVVISNQNIAQAEATYRQALALVRVARAAYFPTITLGASVTRSLPSQNAPGAAGGSSSGSVTDISFGLGATWEPDLWGRIRRTVESTRGSAEATGADLAGVRLIVQAQVANAYLQLRAIDADARLLQQTIAAFAKTLELTINRFRGGVASRADVDQARTQLEATRAQAIDIGVQRAQFEHALATFIGQPASTFTLVPAERVPPVPGIPFGVPSDLLERRPDVSGAERRVAAANAQIGIAKAAYFPQVTLGASVGFEATMASNLLSAPSHFWSVGPAVSQVLFSGGARRAQVEQVRAGWESTVAAYRQTVLAAFQEVEDTLASLRILAEEAQAQAAASAAAQSALTVTTERYRSGIVSFLDVVTSQTILLNNQRAEVNIRQRQFAAAVQLIRAIGGGWTALTPSRRAAR